MSGEGKWVRDMRTSHGGQGWLSLKVNLASSIIEIKLQTIACWASGAAMAIVSSRSNRAPAVKCFDLCRLAESG